MGSAPSMDGTRTVSSMDRVPLDMQVPTRQTPKPWREIPSGNSRKKKRKGSREGLTVQPGGSGTNVPAGGSGYTE